MVSACAERYLLGQSGSLRAFGKGSPEFSAPELGLKRLSQGRQAIIHQAKDRSKAGKCEISSCVPGVFKVILKCEAAES